MKRIFLFLLTNIAILAVLSISARILGIDRFLTSNGLNMTFLLAFSALIGFGGSFISLLLSKKIAKWSTRAQVIQQPSNQGERWLVDTVAKLATKAGLKMPEVAIYEGAP
ncbi:MAG: zinc metalloprotease HtpX, partial [Candidatus Electrothrix sp. ATG2]|nr:zinc metalloprotease HtpX [Candidatus Electrothrix sp. ATG2]